MALLGSPRQTPPDGFRYIQRETTVRFMADSLTELTDMVVQHRVWKNLHPQDRETVEKEIQRQICEGQFPGVCVGENGENYKPLVDQSRNLSPDKVVEFSKAAFRFVESGGEMVDKKESERRAAICRSCQFNRQSVCLVCTPMLKMLDAIIPDSRREPNLLVCGICGCGLGVKVLLPLTTIQGEEGHSKLRFPSHCWLSG